jgi:hypothetical protein
MMTATLMVMTATAMSNMPIMTGVVGDPRLGQLLDSSNGVV